MRYSTETSDIIDDRIPQPRGLGMKILNVKGPKFGDPDYETHDIEFNNAPMIELGSAKVAREIFELRIKYADDPEGLKKALKQRDDFEVQDARNHLPNIVRLPQVILV